MRILIATFWHLPHAGGVSTHVYNLRRELDRLGHEVDLFAHHPDMEKYYIANTGRSLEKAKVKGLIYEKVSEYFEKELPHVDRWIMMREIERYSYEVAASTFDLGKYDLIHTQDIISTRAMWRIKPKHVPLIATIHGCLATEYLISGEVKGRDTLPFKYATTEEILGATSSDHTIVTSRWLKDLYVNDFSMPSERLQFIPNGMDIDHFLSTVGDQPNMERREGKLVIACPARLDPVKGHKCLFEALKMLKHERDDWVCWLIGDGDLREELEQLCDRLDLTDQIKFLGSRTDVSTLLAQADLVVLPSLQDNQPFSIMEAQVSGKPIIASDAGGIPEMVEDRKTGLIFQAGQSRELFQLLELVLRDGALREELGRVSKEWSMVQWSMEKMMEQTLSAYQKVVNNRGVGNEIQQK